ncbi:MAG: DNA methylase, partial [Cyanobacteria bacterium P01_C01_bin.38]
MTQPIQLSLFDYSPQSSLIAEKTGTFSDNMKLPVHRWFRYSAGFSANWTEEVIKELQPNNVLDPFLGSGTVCIVADKL